MYEQLLGDGKKLGISIEYKVQATPRGLADAFIVGEDFIGNDNVCLILGDNVFFGQNLSATLWKAAGRTKGATIFGYPVKNAQAFGVVEFDEEGKVFRSKKNRNSRNPITPFRASIL